MTIEEIRELVHLVLSTGVAEIEVQRGENKVWIKRALPSLTQEVMVPPAVVASVTPAHTSPAAAPAAAATVEDPDLTDPTLVPVKSPIVGTFYEASAPGASPFVKIGDRVEATSIMCIIESMKLMNEIEADVAGVVVKRLVENGQPVEYGETLFLVKPN